MGSLRWFTNSRGLGVQGWTSKGSRVQGLDFGAYVIRLRIEDSCFCGMQGLQGDVGFLSIAGNDFNGFRLDSGL